jgi:hypothetical protein
MKMKLAYLKEDERYPMINRPISNEHAEKIIRKVSRHFKLNVKNIKFRNLTSSSGRASWFCNKITLNNSPTLLVVAHELNHFLVWKKYLPDRKVNHGGKRWLRCLERIIKYCDKKNWWIDEMGMIEKRKNKILEEETERKSYEKTPEYKLELINDSIKKWESKRKRAENALKKLNRRKKIWKKKVIGSSSSESIRTSCK